MARYPRWYEALNKVLQKGEPKGTGVLQMATIEQPNTPRVRSLIHRGFVTATTLPTLPLILVTTDIRTPKVMQTYHQQRVEVVYWMEKSQEQYRILGRASIVPRMMYEGHYPKPEGIVFDRLKEEGFDWEKKRVMVFDSMSAHMKATWCRPVPGTPLAENGEEEMKNWLEKLPKLGDARNEEEERNLEMALSNFALLLIEPLEVDLVELLRPETGRDRRTNFKRESDRSVEFKETLLVP